MKRFTTLSFIAAAIIGMVSLSAFTTKPEEKKPVMNEYNAQLMSTVYNNGNYEWTYSVTNPNPGDGSGETLQDLSHWSLAISDMVTTSDLVAVQYSTDGIKWNNLPVSLAIDRSQDCYTGSVLKFDFGTKGGAPTYYRLIVNKYFTTGVTMANFKSGKITGCYNGTVEGIGEVSTDPIR
jgi:hypothetical protein